MSDRVRTHLQRLFPIFWMFPIYQYLNFDLSSTEQDKKADYTAFSHYGFQVIIRDMVHRHEDGRTEVQASVSAPPPAAHTPIPPHRSVSTRLCCSSRGQSNPALGTTREPTQTFTPAHSNPKELGIIMLYGYRDCHRTATQHHKEMETGNLKVEGAVYIKYLFQGGSRWQFH